MPESKQLRHLKDRLRKSGRRLKTIDELRGSGITGSGNAAVATLYEVPKNQYDHTPLSDSVHQLSGRTLWHKHEGLDRTWAIKFMASLPDSLDWQLAGVTTGKRKGESGAVIPTMTARYVYVTLKYSLAVTWLVTPTDDADMIGLRFIRSNGETGAKWCQPSDVQDTVKALLNSEYDKVDPKSPRRSWL